ncbi:hypothetical protein BGZ93_000320 [Podila epicladia]|nr:hypothetical protein BGZ93_000320 [Podila epicladia]
MFEPHLWSIVKLSSTTELTDDDEKISTILENKRWIRSLTVAAQHINTLVDWNLTHLQELVLYDENFEDSYEDDHPVNIGTVVALIENNKSLWSLEIDLNRYNYQDGDLSPAIMLAIAGHPSLAKLKWRFPDGHVSDEFCQCLLSACQNSSIRELVAQSKEFIQPYCGICDGECSIARWGCHHFGYKDFNGYEDHPSYQQLIQRLDLPMDQVGSFAFRKLSLSYEFFSFYLPLLRQCPDLQEVGLDFSSQNSAEILELLAGCPTLRGLDLRNGRHDMDYPVEIQRFRQLQRLYIPQVSSDQFERILSSLAESSLQTLEVLGLSTSVAVEEVISVLSTFPKLKEIDVESVKIYIQDMEVPSQILHSIEDLGSDKVIVQDWDPSQVYRADETISEWWDHWTCAQQLMISVASAYAQQSDLSTRRLIYMRFMYPIRAFMLQTSTDDYANGRGLWAGRRRTLTVEDARLMVKEQEAELAARSARQAARYAPAVSGTVVAEVN